MFNYSMASRVVSNDAYMFNLVLTLRDCIKGDCSCSIVSFWQFATVVTISLSSTIRLWWQQYHLLQLRQRRRNRLLKLCIRHHQQKSTRHPTFIRHKLKTQVSMMILSVLKMMCLCVYWWKLLQQRRWSPRWKTKLAMDNRTIFHSARSIAHYSYWVRQLSVVKLLFHASSSHPSTSHSLQIAGHTLLQC